MNIRSNKEGKNSLSNWFQMSPKVFFRPFLESAYWRTFIWILILSLLISFSPFSWGLNIALVILSLIGLTFYINYRLGDYNDLDFGKYFLLMILFIIMSGKATYMPMSFDYNNSERIDETLIMDKETKLFYNDSNYVFILFVDSVKQPLTIDRDKSDVYNRMKADFLDGKIKVEKKRVKAWYEDEITEGYYLDGDKFD